MPTPPSRRRPAGRPPAGADLRDRILTATLSLLTSTGDPDRVTVAAVVAAAGCTPPSLYHYWPQRELLLTEACGRGWEEFRQSQDRVGTETDPLRRLRLRGTAYLEFALAQPALFRVLFLRPAPARPDGADLQPGAALQGLLADVGAAMAAGRLIKSDPLTVGLALWSTVHGVAALWIANPAMPADMVRATGELAQSAVLTGLTPTDQHAAAAESPLPDAGASTSG